MLLRRERRRGSVIVENAVVMPLTFLLLLGMPIGAIGIFRYNQVAHLAHEVARYAATHAGDYESENTVAIAAGTLPTVDKSYLTTSVLDAKAAGFDQSKLTVTVSIVTPSGTYDWDSTASNNNRANTTSVTVSGTTTLVNNMVSVTVSYQWLPEAFLAGSFTLKSTSVQAMSY